MNSTSDNTKTASSLLIEDYVRTHISKSPLKGMGRHSRPDAPFLPKASESPFGKFPGGYNTRSLSPQKKNEATVSSSHPDISASLQHAKSVQHKKTGNGGACSSLLQGKKPAPRPAPKAGALERRRIPPTQFRRFYDRGDLPINIEHKGTGNIIAWKVEINKLDYRHYLPIFFDGLREKEEPYRFFAVEGTMQMLADPWSKQKIVNCIPQLIIPMKTALNTRDPEIMCTVIKVIQQLIHHCGDEAGIALVPYYRQILPVFNLFKNCNKNTGDAIEYGQRKRLNIGDLIEETLQLMELHGGDDAFINIKYLIPTYESCVLA